MGLASLFSSNDAAPETNPVASQDQSSSDRPSVADIAAAHPAAAETPPRKRGRPRKVLPLASEAVPAGAEQGSLESRPETSQFHAEQIQSMLKGAIELANAWDARTIHKMALAVGDSKFADELKEQITLSDKETDQFAANGTIIVQKYGLALKYLPEITLCITGGAYLFRSWSIRKDLISERKRQINEARIPGNELSPQSKPADSDGTQRNG